LIYNIDQIHWLFNESEKKKVVCDMSSEELMEATLAENALVR